MSDQEWWETSTEIEDSEPGPSVELEPREASEVELYSMPERITAKWVQAQMTKNEWKEVSKYQKNLNPHMIEQMSKLARKGLPNAMIMARSGFTPALWRTWERKAAMEEEPYALWYKCVMYSRSKAEERFWDQIESAGADDWKASKWLMEQLNKEEYSSTPKSQTVNVHGDVKQEQSINYMSEKEAVEVARIMKQIGALPESDDVVEGEVVEDDNKDG